VVGHAFATDLVALMPVVHREAYIETCSLDIASFSYTFTINIFNLILLHLFLIFERNLSFCNRFLLLTKVGLALRNFGQPLNVAYQYK